MSKQLPGTPAARIVLLVTALAITYFLITAALGAVRSYQLQQREDRLRTEIAELQTRYERLDALKAYLNSDEFIESAAREQLGLVRQGETGFITISSQPAPTPAPDEPRPETLVGRAPPLAIPVILSDDHTRAPNAESSQGIWWRAGGGSRRCAGASDAPLFAI